jgi:uncharacterized protein YukJ
MPLKAYSILKGRPIGIRFATAQNAHYQVHVVDDLHDYRIAINVQSGDGSEVAYAVVPRFEHPMLEQPKALPPGMHDLDSRPGGAALDYIRGNLLQPTDMAPLPLQAPGPDNDLNEKLDHYVQRAMADDQAVLYAFGEPWGPEPTRKDKFFGFLPGRGIHDIHMNQGNPPPPAGKQQWFNDNGPWQDGGLVFEFPRQGEWVAVFLKFQSQAWHTDDRTGHPLDLVGGGPPTPTRPTPRIEPGHVPTEELPDGLVRIVGALVNAVTSPERETVTLLNTSDREIDLKAGSWPTSAR